VKLKRIRKLLKLAKRIGDKSLILIEKSKDDAITNTIVFDNAAKINKLTKEFYEILREEEARILEVSDAS
tara:strand:- start:2406 stop:2615 length:210 start_codon:yes stop_codon:yes gene_type:complete